MILEIRNRQPMISFGLLKYSTEVSEGEAVKVWLKTLYNENEFTFQLISVGGVKSKISNYQYSVVYDVPGTYTIELRVTSNLKKITLYSNPLTITVV